MFSIALVIIALLGIAIVILGFAVYIRNARNFLNNTFFLFTLGVALWIVINYISCSINVSHEVSLWANRLVLIVGGVTLLLLLIFILALTSWLSRARWLRYLIALSVTSWIACLTPYVVYDVSVKNSQVANEFGILAPLYFGTLFFTAILVAATLFRAHYKLEGILKKQVDSIAISVLIAIPIIIVGNAVLPIVGYYELVSYTPLALALIVAAMTYVIARHKLFDIRLVVARTLAYGLSIILVVAIYAVSSFLLATAVFDVNITFKQEIFFAIFSAITALAFQPIKRFFDKYTNSIFYKDAYDGQEIINSVNSTIVNTIDPNDLLRTIADILEAMMRVTYADFYLNSKAAAELHATGTNTKLFENPRWPNFVKEFSKYPSKTASIVDTDLPDVLKGLMQELSVEAALKMSTTADSVGFYVVGTRKSGNSFSNQDIQLLEIVADEVAIAVQSALRFEEISQFNVTLQKKIEDATSQLKRSNEKLKALDEAKDDFVSMASHQLRTPLTSVKGYLSMVLEGDAGELNEQQRSMLDQAFTSSQRMTYLIADLLNLSRLKTGKFVIENTPTDLAKVITQELSQVEATAEARKLTITYHEPETFPTLLLDQTKIRQVIMNFVDNAIYYTPSGGEITVKLEELEKSIEFTVHDTGIGVPASEQHNLFTKFYRAANAKQARPDGTGLGLFMAKKVIIAQGGATIFKSQPGKGSTFGFSFPKTLTTNEAPKIT